MPDSSRLPDPRSQPVVSTNGQAPPSPAPASVHRRPHGWIWYFAILAVLTLAATVTLIVYNLSQQLKPAELAKARKLWEEKGPKDYEFRYTTRAGVEDRVNHFKVTVRGGKVQAVTLNQSIELPKERLHYYSMTALFDQIERFMDLDIKPGAPKVYVVGHFNQTDGHLARYVRRVMGSRERVEILVEEFHRLDGTKK